MCLNSTTVTHHSKMREWAWRMCWQTWAGINRQGQKTAKKNWWLGLWDILESKIHILDSWRVFTVVPGVCLHMLDFWVFIIVTHATGFRWEGSPTRVTTILSFSCIDIAEPVLIELEVEFRILLWTSRSHSLTSVRFPGINRCHNVWK